MKTYTMPQGSPEWHRIRRGVVTASEVDVLITPLWKPRTGDGVETFLCAKIAERMLADSEDEPDEGGAPSYAADQGHILESMAVPWFEFEHGLTVQRVGFCLSDDGRIGCSPDGLIGDDAGIEIKSPQPTTHIAYLRNGVVPKAHLAQVHFSMYVTGRPRWWFVSYSQQLPKLAILVERDEAIQEKLRAAVEPFLNLLDVEFDKIKLLGKEGS